TIGELSRRTGVKIPTIRYYEQIGLLDEPARTEGGQRRYGAEALTRLGFIRHARTLGFEIEAIRDLVLLSSDPDQSCDEVDTIAAQHLKAVEQRIAQLHALRGELQTMLTACKGGKIARCRVLESLSRFDQGAATQDPADNRRTRTP
ncbi:MAG: helix-turn-helix domain-containing protein, partial [Hyphomicrobiales bacterium]|nr:helix-turn-helix domain-containing protein [Hyphomicrobiales bacterium]